MSTSKSHNRPLKALGLLSKHLFDSESKCTLLGKSQMGLSKALVLWQLFLLWKAAKVVKAEPGIFLMHLHGPSGRDTSMHRYRGMCASVLWHLIDGLYSRSL
jgi:hypothetical protein